MDSKIILDAMNNFIKAEGMDIVPEVFSDIVMCRFDAELLDTTLSVKINCSAEDGNSPYLKIWLDLDIPVKDDKKIESYNEIRKIINHANRNNIIGKIWIEEYVSMRGNVRWSTCQFLSPLLKKNDIEKVILNLYTAAYQELAPWIKPFIAVASKKADAVTAVKKAKIDIEPFDLEKDLLENSKT